MDDLVPRGHAMSQDIDPERQEGTQRIRARMKQLQDDYTATGLSMPVCGVCVTLIERGEVFALHYNPIRMVGQIHCLDCHALGSMQELARYMLVQEVNSGASHSRTDGD
jgi:hypothetical protein